MLNRIFVVSGLALCVLAAVGCSSDPAPVLVVYHLSDRVVAVREANLATSPREADLESHFPSVCVDDDEDADGLPDSLDTHDSDVDDDVDGGSDDDAEDRDHGHDCERCNRGPGNQGDFRYEIRGDEAELDRGKVIARNGAELTVPSPDGAIVIEITAETEVRDGDPAPGAEIRAQGKLVTVGGRTVLHALRVEVLCDAPPPVDPSVIPADAETLPVAN